MPTAEGAIRGIDGPEESVFGFTLGRLGLHGCPSAKSQKSPRYLDAVLKVVSGSPSISPESGGATSTLNGDIDEVRLSRGARYPAEGFTPLRRHVLDEQTVLLLPMDGALGPHLRGGRAAGATMKAGARLIQD